MKNKAALSQKNLKKVTIKNLSPEKRAWEKEQED